MAQSQDETIPYPNQYTLLRTTTGTIIPSRRLGMTNQIRDQKIIEFEYYVKEIENLENSKDQLPPIELVLEINTKGIIAYLSYFIGRLNPPHNGHILALQALIEKAREYTPYTPPLILLGSGPKGLKTLDNPISYDLKREFIIYKLGELGIPESQFTIMNMSNTALNIREYIHSQLSEESNIETIKIVHVAGDKDDDKNKLAFALKAAESEAQQMLPGISVSAQTESIIASPSLDMGKAMSATQVRKDAYKTLLEQTSYTKEDWFAAYGSFYGHFAEPIYNAIIDPAKTLSEQEIKNYIENSILPSNKKSRKGGSKKQKSRNQKNKKSKRKTQRKKIKYNNK